MLNHLRQLKPSFISLSEDARLALIEDVRAERRNIAMSKKGKRKKKVDNSVGIEALKKPKKAKTTRSKQKGFDLEAYLDSLSPTERLELLRGKP